VIELLGVDIYDPVTATVQSARVDKIAAWFLDPDYDGRTFCIGQAFFPDASAWDKIKRALKSEVDEAVFATFSGSSLPAHHRRPPRPHRGQGHRSPRQRGDGRAQARGGGLMARAKKAAAGDERAPVQAVENPILNGPYDEPALHWSYDPTGKAMKVGRRREAGYWAEDKAALRGQLSLDALDAQEVKPYDVLYLVNALRADVKRWRESGYRGTTETTRALFAHWFRVDRARRLFFCQREAIETLVYVLELALPGQLARTKYKSFAVPPETFARLFSGQPAGYPNDDEPWAARLVDSAPTASEVLRRLGCKMATGAGKTVVMAMTIAWAFCNRARNPRSTEFPLAVLVCAPNLTVKERLQVLKPASPNNFYDAFELVPRALREALNRGVVEVVNWHAFAPASEHGPGGNRVVNLGPESPEAFFKNRLARPRGARAHPGDQRRGPPLLAAEAGGERR
jgi:hypothetical protein